MAKANIDFLVADLKPVQPLKLSGAYFLAAALIALISLLIVLIIGVRADIAVLAPKTIVLVRSGVLLLLGVATLHVIALSARPGVDTRSDGWKWTLAVAGMFPAVTAVNGLLGKPSAYEAVITSSGMWCIGISLTSALFIGAALTIWLRRGAPASINRSSWLIGLSAGSLGTFCYNLYCPSQSIEYVGVWYSLAVLFSAIAGRLIAPRFIRW